MILYSMGCIPILTWGFVLSKAVAYVRAAFSTAAPFGRQRACCKGLTELPCKRADRAVRKKGVTVRTNAGMINELMEIRKGGERKQMVSLVLLNIEANNFFEFRAIVNIS